MNITQVALEMHFIRPLTYIGIRTHTHTIKPIYKICDVFNSISLPLPCNFILFVGGIEDCVLLFFISFILCSFELNGSFVPTPYYVLFTMLVGYVIVFHTMCMCTISVM